MVSRRLHRREWQVTFQKQPNGCELFVAHTEDLFQVCLEIKSHFGSSTEYYVSFGDDKEDRLPTHFALKLELSKLHPLTTQNAECLQVVWRNQLAVM